MANNGKIAYSIGIDNTKLRSDATESKQILRNISSSAVEEGQKMDDAFKNVGKAIAGAMSIAAAASFAKKIISVRAQIQGLEISFRTLLGSAEKADALFSDIREYAVKTPLLLKDLASSSQMLLSFGIQAEEVMPIMKALGDISMGDSQKLQSLTLAFSQATSVGKLMGQDLLQMINAGFNPLSVMAEKTGKSIGELKEEMSKGAITADMLKQAFLDATSSGGKFNGMLENQSKSINGAISNLQGALDDMFNEIGEKIEEPFIKGIELTTALTKHYEILGKVLMTLIASFGAYKAAMISVIAYQKGMAIWGNVQAFLSLTKSIKSAKDAMILLNLATKANPVGLVIGTIAAAATAFSLYKSKVSDSEKALKRLDKVTEEMNKNIAKEKVAIDELFDSLKKAKKGTDEYDVAKNAILSQYGKYLKGLNDEIKALNDVEGAYKAITKAVEEMAQAKALEKANSNAIEDYTEKVGDIRAKIYKALTSGDEKYTAEEAHKFVNEIIDYADGKSELSERAENALNMTRTRKHNENSFNLQEINTITRLVNEFKEAKKGYEAEKELAKVRFGGASTNNSTISEDKGNNTESKAPETKNKKYYEAKKKEAQEELESLEITAETKGRAEELKKTIIEIDKKLAQYSISNDGSDSKGKASSNDIEEEQLKRIEQIRKYSEEEKKIFTQSELEKRQLKISLMKEGFEKEFQQNELNYDRMMNEINKREQDMLRRLEEVRILEWKKENPEATDKEEIEYRQSLHLTSEDLTGEQREQLEEFVRIAEETLQSSNKATLEKMLSDVLTYEQEREKIAEEYAHKREELEFTHNEKGERIGKREGVSEENLQELDTQRDESLNAIDEEFASREESYQAWMEQISNQTIEKLTETLAKAEKELKELEKKGAKGNKVAEARAKVSKTRKALDKAQARNEVKPPNKRSLKQWKELQDVLQKGVQGFEELGDAIGGTAGEMMKSAGQIMSGTLSMINAILTLTVSASTGMTATASAGATAIKTVEKASVILAVIGTALQIATTIANLFTQKSTQEQYEETSKVYNAYIDVLDKIIDRHLKLAEALSGKNAIEEYKEAITLSEKASKAAREMGKMYLNSGASWRSHSKGRDEVHDMTTQGWEDAAKALNMSVYGFKQIMGSRMTGLFDLSVEQLEKLQQDAPLFFAQLDSDTREYVDQILSSSKQVEEIFAQQAENFTGMSFDSLSESIIDSLYDIEIASEDIARDMGDNMRKALIKAMYVKNYEPEMKKWYDQWAKAMEDGELSESEKESLDTLKNSLISGAINAARDINEYFESEGLGERTASEEGIATASQDSIDELNGRATAIQGHTYSIMESTKLLVSNTNAILSSVMNIDRSTENADTKLGLIEGEMRELKDTMNDIVIKGVKIK